MCVVGLGSVVIGLALAAFAHGWDVAPAFEPALIWAFHLGAHDEP